MAPGTLQEGRLGLAVCLASLTLAAAVILALLPAAGRGHGACGDRLPFTGPLGTPFVGDAACPPAR